MADREGVITFKGKPLTLEGKEPKLAKKAPDFTVTGADMSEIKLSQFAGKIVIISAVPSLDTPTCNIETRRFDQEAAKLGDEVVVLTISKDLPFAQKRWCGEANVHKVITASDYRDGQFARKYGVLVRELKLLARAIFVVGRDGRLMYQQIVPEISQEPNYDEAINAVRALAAQTGKPGVQKQVPQPVSTSN